MDEFRGEDAQYERLRDALRTLYNLSVKSAQLERLAEKEAQRLGTGCMSRTSIDKFRTGEVDRPREIRTVFPLWNAVFSPKFGLPTADRSEPVSPGQLNGSAGAHDYFHSSVRFFDVHKHRQARVTVDLLGRFAFYHFSEYFHKFSNAIPRAVVVGQWDIKLEDGAYCVEEKQRYDGRLGQIRMLDYYLGYCLPKGPNICLIMREAKKETPKFYMLEAVHDNPETLQTEALSGYMLKGSHKQKFFHSPVYAIRVPDNRNVECNIVRCADVPEHLLHELETLSNR